MKKSILFFESHSAYFDGSQQSLFLMIKRLDKSKYNPVFVGTNRGTLDRELKKIGVETIILHQGGCLNQYHGKIQSLGWFKKFLLILHLLSYNLKVMGIIREKEVELIHCNSIRALLTIALAAKIKRVPVIWHLRLQLELGLLNLAAALIADKIVIVADRLKQDFPGWLRKKFVTVHNIFNFDDLHRENGDIRRELGIGRDCFCIAVTGSINPRKGQEYLLQAALEVVKVFGEVKFIIVGEAKNPQEKEYEERLRRFVDERGLNGHVVFTGWRRDVANVLKGMDLFILPSLNEGFPRSILEAMALGKPVVATDVGGNSELVVNEKTGIIIPPADPEALAKAIFAVLKNRGEALRMGVEGRKRVETLFSFDREHAIERVFEGILERG